MTLDLLNGALPLTLIEMKKNENARKKEQRKTERNAIVPITRAILIEDDESKDKSAFLH
jgi:hypothetical protein